MVKESQEDRSSRQEASPAPSSTLVAYSGKPRKTNKDGRPRKQRKGWGPFHSVLRERSVEFNLTLDVQNLRQQVQDLTTLRDVFASQNLAQRHTLEGSLAKTANEYFNVFHKGAVLHESGRKRSIGERDQRAFLHSIMDPEVDISNGLKGPDAVMQQLVTYATFVKFIYMKGQAVDVRDTDGTVLVFIKGSFKFQVLRSTIEMVFPHVIGDEFIVAQLVGKEVMAQARSTFHFNDKGKCVKYEVDVDFVEAFMAVVNNPLVVDILLGKALIADNSMFGIVDEDEEEKEGVDEYLRRLYMDENKNYLDADAVVTSPSSELQPGAQEFCQRIVEGYLAAFALGYREASAGSATTPAEISQRDFLLHRFVSEEEKGPRATVSRVKDRWRALSECFEVLAFEQKDPTSFKRGERNNTCLAKLTTRYILRITSHTMPRVFPHVVPHSSLMKALVGKVLLVPSEISISIASSTGRISQVREWMDFAVALAEVLATQKDVDFVLSEALLTQDGVDIGGHSTTTASGSSASDNQQIQLPRPYRSGSDHSSSPRSMRLADILN